MDEDEIASCWKTDFAADSRASMCAHAIDIARTPYQCLYQQALLN